MDTLLIKNIGTLLSGNLGEPIIAADAILIEKGRFSAIGCESDMPVEPGCRIIDARGTTVIPGLIDSHVHVTFGDFTPRQRTLDFIDSYMHGGITTMVSASEIHTPGCPNDPVGVKALAVAAAKCFHNFSPSGVRVHGGSIIVVPGLTEKDFLEVAAAGVSLAKIGFGAFAKQVDAEPMVRWAQSCGIKVMSHTGGASIPGSSPMTAEDLLVLKPDVAGHVNGGTTALKPEHMELMVKESDIYLQIVQAGNLRSALRIISLARDLDCLGRVIIASDTPTGTGMIPLAVLKTICEVSSLSEIAPEIAVSFATGNNAAAFGLDTGLIEEGAKADLVIMDAPLGSYAADALGAIKIGDIPGISAVIIGGQIQALKSRNTPTATRLLEPPSCRG